MQGFLRSTDDGSCIARHRANLTRNPLFQSGLNFFSLRVDTHNTRNYRAHTFRAQAPTLAHIASTHIVWPRVSWPRVRDALPLQHPQRNIVATFATATQHLWPIREWSVKRVEVQKRWCGSPRDRRCFEPPRLVVANSGQVG